ncbi:Ig-like domain-containing protein [Frondihabitans sp. PAMC 28766]|uniref:Ig-like domain-containing protein n=1 Tax=Frondihabitans sp. PAMC 28766 TaxID=1795630 RepID=UPI0012FF9AA0|nr:Ig-like domain-containing protein [Frondihabitans sp. PAMC 28766]
MAATGLVAVVIAAVAATIGLTSSGYQAQRVSLSDGTVWVVNDSQTAIGRANPAVLQLNSAVRSTGTDLSVVQDADHVLLLDESDATVGAVDTSSASVSQTVPLPPNAPDVLLAGDTAVIVSGKTGEFWSTPVSQLTAFDATAQAELTLGSNVVTGITPSGTLVAYSPDSGQLSRVDQVSSFGVSSSTRVSMRKTDSFQVASVGRHWAVLDTTRDLLVVDGHRVDLSGRVTGRVALQQSSDTGSVVRVAATSGLLDVSFSGAVTSRVSGRAGDPARPVVVGGCTYAAWTDGAGWNDCTSSGQLQKLPSMPASASLAFQVNGPKVVLNDTAGGSSWAVQRHGQLIDNWSDLITDDKTQQQQQTQNDREQQKLEVQEKPPVAVADAMGARPGRATVLPVLLNDYDPNGDPLVITSVTGVPAGEGHVNIISSAQQILITLTAGASGTIGFDYTITDGRGGSSTAHVVVTVKPPGVNGAPAQVRSTHAVVASSGRVTVDTLGDWVDPDGDPFYLTSATGADGGTVTFKPTGEVVYQDAGKGPSTQEILLTVSDGKAVGRGSLTITVSAAGQVPLTAESFSVEAYSGEVTTVSPLQYAQGGTGTIKLNSVPAKAGATITPSYAAGTFTFVSLAVGTHNLEYTVTDGNKTATGTVRVDVQAPPQPNTPPITTPKSVFVQSLSTQEVDITASDFDPAGNVLMITSTTALPVSSGVQVQVLEQRYLRITLTAPLDKGPVSFTYTVTNGLASSQGSVTVIQIPRPAVLQPPIATNDQATARVGEAIDIDVLANDEQPDGEAITLQPKLVKNVSSGGGLLFVSGTVLRYLAPKTPGNFTAEYAIEGTDGQRATAQVSISVREADAATNNPPVPQALTARVVSGQTVRIQVPLNNIDPDGDSVQLLGVDSNPQKGNVTSVGADYIDYEAGTYSVGTDSFTYSVIDSLGARATGTIRVGISPRAEGARNPIAVADAVTMRPGGSILVRALANDSDPDGGALHLTGVKPNNKDVTAEIQTGGIVRITPPKTPGTYGLVYTVANDVGGSSSNFITVKVEPGAALNYPEAQDSVLTLADVLHRKTVDVNVLANVFFADGNVSSLGLGLLPGYGDTAQVTSNHRIRVTVTNTSQIIPFYVSHPEDPSIRAYAFIRVPGFDDALPQINEAAAPLSVVSEKTLTIDINKYVISTNPNGVRLTDSSTVRATHADGSNLVTNSTTLTYTSAPAFFGQASISFQVTDGTSTSDPSGHTATLVLPIQVTPRANQPPVFNGATLDLEPGDTRTLDLTKLTTYNYPKDIGELRYQATSSGIPGFSYSISGQSLTVKADSDATKGSSTSLGITVRDSASTGQSGSIDLTVVGSTRPLAIAASDSAVTKRGSTTVINVLANDEATNPFPGQPLRVLAIRGVDGSSVPPGVTITPSADNSRLSVAVSSSAKPLDTHLQYEIADVTNDPSRYVWGDVTISVEDVPAAPAAPIRSGTFVGGQLTLSYAAPLANNSAITSYRLTGSSASGSYTKDCGTSTLCTLTNLDPATPYTFRVAAVNGIGTSPQSPSSPSYSADYVPSAPTGVTVTPSSSSPGALNVNWSTVPTPAKGSPVMGYVVEIAGQGAPGTQSVPASATSTSIGGLTPGAQYSVQVYATNSAQVSSTADWARSAVATGTAVGVPSTVNVTATLADNASGNVRITHTASDPAGGGSVAYTVARANGADQPAPACSPTSKPGAISAPGGVDSSAQDGQSYTYFVYSDNGLFCSASKSNSIQSLAAPGQASATVTVANNNNTGYFDVQVDSDPSALSVASGTAVLYQVSTDNGSTWNTVNRGDFLTSLNTSGAVVYGNSQSFLFRGCRDSAGTICGPKSTIVMATPISTRTTVNVCVPGQTLSTNPPQNGSGINPDSYSVQFNEPLVPGTDNWVSGDPDGTPFTTTSTVPDNATQVKVQATVQGFQDPAPPAIDCGG